MRQLRVAITCDVYSVFSARTQFLGPSAAAIEYMALSAADNTSRPSSYERGAVLSVFAACVACLA